MQDVPEEVDIDVRTNRGSVYRYQGPRDTTGLEKIDTNVEPRVIPEPAPTQPNGQQGSVRPPPPSAARRQATFALPPETPASAKRSVYGIQKIADPDPAADRLDNETTPLAPEHFYYLMGMRPPATEYVNPKKLATDNGLYATIHHEYRYTDTKYRIFDVMTYFLLALQLLLGAIFIILGSLTEVDSHIAIAVLGAVSTIVAGVLALMKGQGLPNRLRHLRDNLHMVVFEAEELYWDVGTHRDVYYRDVRKLREDFLRVMEEGRKNHPDTWNAAASEMALSVQAASRKTQPSQQNVAPSPDAAKAG